MKKLFTLCVAIVCVSAALAQDSSVVKKKGKKDWSRVNISNRPNDHFMLQLGYYGWATKPDSASFKSIPRSFNMYFMYDFPFKTDPRFSIAAGIGIGTDNVYFNKTTTDITGTSNSSTLTFGNGLDSNYFKKYKMGFSYLEAPIELRFAKDPENTNKTLKAAIGIKIGTLLSAETKGKNLLNKSGGVINSFTEKIKSKHFFNPTRLQATARISLGVIGIYGSYQVTNFIRTGLSGPEVRPFQIGLTLSGL
jgi:hypothetical protein